MQGTWLDNAPAAAGGTTTDALFWRCFFLAVTAAGLVQKVGTTSCWDWHPFHEALGQLWRRRASLALLGGTAIIARSVFASAGVGVVAALALELHKQGRVWDYHAFRTLLSRLRALPAAQAGRQRGRLVQNSGPFWVSKMLQQWDGSRWASACKHVGSLFGAPAAAEGSTHAGDVCRALEGDSKVPGLGRYGVCSLLRNALASRAKLDGACVALEEASWAKWVRGMHKDTVTLMLDRLGTRTLGDAEAMVRTLAGTSKSMFSTRVSAKRSVAVSDLSVAACETTSLISTVRKKLCLNPQQRGSDRNTAEWVLQRLPSTLQGLRRVSKCWRIKQRNKTQGGDDDPESASAVGAAWFSTSPPEAPGSMLRVACGEKRSPWKLPKLWCITCKGKLRAGSSRRVRCDVCTAEARKATFRISSAKRRRVQ